MSDPLLPTIHSPADLKKLPLASLKALAQEVRQEIIQTVSQTGGHLASSLGAVELTLALHRAYNTPEDLIVWDVGHQTYAHKLLTGRRERFATLRQEGGISGFPKREESPYDAFNTGHSSTSISAALGMARARDLAEKKHKVVAVIGDGSISNGLAFEALNDAGHQKTDLLVILNDNRMSISSPVGGLSNYLNQILTGRMYNRLKGQVEGLVAAIPAVGKSALKLTYYLEEIAKGLLVPGVLFEELGFRYFGPVDGHDLETLLATLERVRSLSGPIFLHVQTQKGKGFEFAEQDPVAFHGTPQFDAGTGKSKVCSVPTYSQAFSQTLLHLARQHPSLVAIVAAMTSGTALEEFAQTFPKRFFDVGIAEGHAVTLAAGLAAAGFRPVVAIYSTFLQRAYDQVLHDVCLQNLPVIFALDRAGVVGEDGPTHHGLYDLAYLRHLPNLAVFAPADEKDLVAMLKAAVMHPGPVAIRYPRGSVASGCIDLDEPQAKIGQARVVRTGTDVALLGLGNMLAPALAAAEKLARRGVQALVMNPGSVKPLDSAALRRVAGSVRALVTIEDHVVCGGFGSAVLEWLQAEGMARLPVRCLGFPDEIIGQATRDQLFSRYGLTADHIADAAWRLLQPAAKARRAKKSAASGGRRGKRS
ncbi:MAG: 1-deoxy-D-xylulose-5-phosphate synthase [candidate division FCPU426 bacterium]